MQKFNVVLRVIREYVLNEVEAFDKQDLMDILDNMKEEGTFDLSELDASSITETSVDYEVDGLEESDND